jgi:hypothetical protein
LGDESVTAGAHPVGIDVNQSIQRGAQ